jgi:16S rRNA processing protein RimM
VAQTARGERDDLLLIGTIGVPFGLKGQVKLHALTSRPEQLRRIKTLFVGEAQTPIKLRRAVEHKANHLVLTLEGIADRAAADQLRGAEVFILEADAAPLDEDEYFLHDLPGLKVETVAGEAIGVVKEVLETGANDVLVVTRLDGAEALIPMIRDVVKSLDLKARRITIEPMEGLLS